MHLVQIIEPIISLKGVVVNMGVGRIGMNFIFIGVEVLSVDIQKL